MTPLEIVALINSLLSVAANAGIAWSRLRAAIDAAQAAGRPFDLADLEGIADQAQADVNALREAIARAKSEPKP